MKTYRIRVGMRTWSVPASSEKAALVKVLRQPETKPTHIHEGREWCLIVQKEA